jgi:hypothetical protein
MLRTSTSASDFIAALRMRDPLDQAEALPYGDLSPAHQG